VVIQKASKRSTNYVLLIDTSKGDIFDYHIKSRAYCPDRSGTSRFSPARLLVQMTLPVYKIPIHEKPAQQNAHPFALSCLITRFWESMSYAAAKNSPHLWTMA